MSLREMVRGRRIRLLVSVLAVLTPEAASFAQTPEGPAKPAPSAPSLDGPLTPEKAPLSFQLEPGLRIELVAAEPLIVDPVAIDWGPDGKLWVVEMRDYPMGIDGKWKPGGRVKYLEDLDGDGHCERATIFLEGLPFPTGVMAWRKGVLEWA